ncbi:MAG: hypothetical protein HQK83_04270 [Fibrobacteria bacterium]|nr:hypothetical protein [Fibrobacteria bacterium]
MFLKVHHFLFFVLILSTGMYAQDSLGTSEPVDRSFVSPVNKPKPVNVVPVAPVVPERKITATSKPFGFVSFTVVPGFKHILFDKESTLGFANKILVPSGSHLVDIFAPSGYEDTSFSIQVNAGSDVEKEVRLRNKGDGKITRVHRETEVATSSSFLSTVKVSCFTLAIVTGIVAYYEERQASRARTQYDALNPNADYNQLSANLNNHIKWRNAMAIVAGASFIAGGITWFF